MEYELELERAIREIKKKKAKLVLLQLPDGLKPEAKEIADRIKDETKTQVMIWAGSCFGACDIPYEVEKLGVDMILTYGHSGWNRPELR